MKKKEYIGPLVFFLIILLIAFFLITVLHGKSNKQETEILRDSIKQATIQCYALEGRYPSDIQYLVDHYGIQIDEKHYAVFYEGFADNIMPEITVMPLDSSDGGDQ